jgi:sigma-B regulation protein RsbU (phosphoserine phosphatase)
MRILIAEDERITRMTLTRQLTTWGHEVTAVEDGQQALDQFTAGEFDIVITDWEMPRLSGLELVRRMREVKRAIYTYVILLTSRSDKSDVVAGIEAGADDFVSKPFDKEELRVRLLAGERIVTLERALHKQNAELRDANERIKSGLRAAARVQQSMLPKQNVITPRVRTAWKYVPTDELAGDAIGLHLIDDRFLIAYVLDVSGHGVPAALLSVSAMHSMEPQEGSLMRDIANPSGELGTVQRPARAATELNRRFRAGENDGRYLTMILIVLDTHTGRLHFTSAGHPPPILLRGAESIGLPDAGGFPIAIVDGAEYEDGSIELAPGDRLCLFSDGVLEQTDAKDQEQYGDARLHSALAARTAIPADQAVTEIVTDLSAWAGGGSFTDDVSLVIVEWLGSGR